MSSILGLIENAKFDPILTFTLIITVTILFNLNKISEFLDSHRNKRSLKLKNAISDDISDELREHLKQEVDVEHFRLIYGVEVSPKMLEHIFELKRMIYPRVGFRHILRIAKLGQNSIEVKEKKILKVKMSILDRISAIYNLLAGASVLVVGVWLFLVADQYTLLSLALTLILIGFGIVLLIQSSILLSVYYANSALKKHGNVNSPKLGEDCNS
ncbi:hypothetical protein [Veronia pacifica]|uniref:Uncharacterized protein n=1 Tax=Veronia pacifica TaxID=1080227 RepID=A0A1C3E990_9GAMM|nr:hypothetical protein [Veronia pacifica]ODA29838.1 hypothetical protein A8L45_21625 [Veronia pacifica]